MTSKSKIVLNLQGRPGLVCLAVLGRMGLVQTWELVDFLTAVPNNDKKKFNLGKTNITKVVWIV